MHDAGIEPHTLNRTLAVDRPAGLFKHIHSDTVFADEIADTRNPMAHPAYALRRICQKAGYVTGATATPIYTSPLDIANIARNMGLPFVHDNPSKNLVPELMVTDTHCGYLPVVALGGRYDFSGCAGPIANLSGDWVKFQSAMLEARAKLRAYQMTRIRGLSTDAAKPIKDRVDGNDAYTGPIWKQLLEYDSSDATESDLNRKFLDAGKKVTVDMMKKIRNIFGPWTMRLTHQTISKCDGLSLTNVRPIYPIIRRIQLPHDERISYEMFEKSGQNESKHVHVVIRRFLRDAHTASGGFWSASLCCHTAIDQRDYPDPRCRHWETGFCQAQGCHIHTMGELAPCYAMQMHLRKAGILSVCLHGDMSTKGRMEVIKGFQDDADQTPTATKDELSDAKTAKRYESGVDPVTGKLCGARVHFFTDVGSTGITLTRADTIFILDAMWTWVGLQQAIARINRIGQTRLITAILIVVWGIKEELVTKKCLDRKDLAEQLDEASSVGTATVEQKRQHAEITAEEVAPVAVSESPSKKKKGPRSRRRIDAEHDVYQGKLLQLAFNRHLSVTLAYAYLDLAIVCLTEAESQSTPSFKSLKRAARRDRENALSEKETACQRDEINDILGSKWIDFDIDLLLGELCPEFASRGDFHSFQIKMLDARDWDQYDVALTLLYRRQPILATAPDRHARLKEEKAKKLARRVIGMIMYRESFFQRRHMGFERGASLLCLRETLETSGYRKHSRGSPFVFMGNAGNMGMLETVSRLLFRVYGNRGGRSIRIHSLLHHFSQLTPR